MAYNIAHSQRVTSSILSRLDISSEVSVIRPGKLPRGNLAWACEMRTENPSHIEAITAREWKSLWQSFPLKNNCWQCTNITVANKLYAINSYQHSQWISHTKRFPSIFFYFVPQNIKNDFIQHRINNVYIYIYLTILAYELIVDFIIPWSCEKIDGNQGLWFRTINWASEKNHNWSLWFCDPFPTVDDVVSNLYGCITS